MPILAEHACRVVDELGQRRDAALKIPSVCSQALLKALGYHENAGKVLGNAVSLLDAVCIGLDFPWLGRVIDFKRSKNDFVGPWASWMPYKEFIVRAALLRQWSDKDLERIRTAASSFEGNPEAWWIAEIPKQEEWLQRTLLVTLRQAYGQSRRPCETL